MSLKSKIQALITAANAKTGETDTTLTDAVQTLVDGYGQGGGILPAGYTQMEYIESSGTQYIDTSYIIKANSVFSYIAAIINPPTYRSICGQSGLGANSDFFISSNTSTNPLELTTFYHFCGSYGEAAIRGVPSGGVCRLIFSATDYYAKYDLFDDVHKVIHNAPPATFVESVYSMVIFGRRTGPDTFQLTAARIHDFVVLENDIEQLHLIPAMRDSDSVLGMYDIVNNQFLTNAGTGEFTGGALD